VTSFTAEQSGEFSGAGTDGPGGRPTRTPVANSSARGIVAAGAVVLIFIALLAFGRLGTQFDITWAAFPAEYGLRGLVAPVVLLVIGAIVVGAVRAADDDALRRWGFWGPLLLVGLLRAIAILPVETPLPTNNDPGFLHNLAVGVLDGGSPLFSARPMAYSAMLAVLYAAFGVHPALAEVLNLGLALLAGWMLFLLVEGEWGRRAAAVALTLYALVPSQILLTTTIFTETAYSAFLIASLALCTVALRRSSVLVAVAAGAVLAVSQYVRPLSQALLATFVLVPFLAGLRAVRAAALAAAIGLTFVGVLLPVAVHNVETFGDLSLSTSSYGGWSVFVGANQDANGMFNRRDQAILRETEGDSVWEQSEILGREGWRRITSDPRGFAELALRKFRILWADDTYAEGAALGGSNAAEWLRVALRLASQAAYVAIAAAAALGMWRQRHRAPPAAILLAGVIITIAAAHVFIEVQPRYHAYVVPLLCALAGMAIAGGVERTPASAAA